MSSAGHRQVGLARLRRRVGRLERRCRARAAHLIRRSLPGPFGLNEGGPLRRLEAFSAQLKALVTTNRARVLAEPNLLVVEGEPADILVAARSHPSCSRSRLRRGRSGSVTVE